MRQGKTAFASQEASYRGGGLKTGQSIVKSDGAVRLRYLFLCSLSVLAFEVLLLRVFSIRYSYHYGSFVISIAMTGYVSGSLLFLRTKLLRGASAETYVFLLGLSFPSLHMLFSVLPFDLPRLLFERTQILYMALFLLLSSIPFFLYAILFSLFLSADPERVPMIYGYDLTGAALGVLLPSILLPLLKIEGCFFLISILPIASILPTLRGKRLLATIVLSFCLLPAVVMVRIEPSPYKGLMQLLSEGSSRLVRILDGLDSRLYLFESPRLRYAPGLSLIYRSPIPSGIGLSLDGEVSGIMLGPSFQSCEFYRFLPCALPYLLQKKGGGRALSIGFKSTYQLFCPSLLFGYDTVLVERDQSIRRMLATDLALGPTKWKVYRGWRSLIKAGQKFDVIALERASFSPSYPFGLAEEMDVTIEALGLLLQGLKEGGILYIEAFFLPPPRVELRLFLTVIEALRRAGIGDPQRRLIVFRTLETVVFLIKNGTFSERQKREIERILWKREWEMLFPYRGGVILESPYDLSSLLSDAFRSDREFIEAYPFDISACSDDRPFFNYFLKLRSIRKIYELSSRRWVYFLYEGMTLPFLLLVLLAVSSALLIPSICRARGGGLIPSLYFASIGFSFMALEVFFIHVCSFLLDSSSMGFCFALLLLLPASGTGSLLIGRFRRPPLLVMLSLPLALLVLYFTSPKPTYAVLLTPLFPLLGVFFPLGMKVLVKNTMDSPFYYALNGGASILSPPLCFMLSLSFGFRTLLLISSLLYIAALSLLHLASHGDEYDRA